MCLLVILVTELLFKVVILSPPDKSGVVEIWAKV